LDFFGENFFDPPKAKNFFDENILKQLSERSISPKEPCQNFTDMSFKNGPTFGKKFVGIFGEGEFITLLLQGEG